MNILLLAMGSQFGYITEHYYYSKYLGVNNKVTVLCCDSGLEKINMERVRVIYMKPRKNQQIQLLHYYIKAIKLSMQEKFDVIFISYFKFCFLLRFIFPLKTLVLDIRTGSIGTKPKVAKANAKLRFEARFFKNKLINTHSLAKELNITKYECLPIGADNQITNAKLFDNIKLLYIGTLDKRRIEDTIEGFKIFINKHNHIKNLRYDIVGFGNHESIDNIQRKIKDLDLAELVHFHGRKTIDKLKAHFKQANIGVAYIPIIQCYQCQPALKTLEYMINGMPVIATKTYEMMQVVDESNGILIEDTANAFAEGLSKFLEKRRNYDSETIKKSVEKYTWANIIHNHLEPYLQNRIKA